MEGLFILHFQQIAELLDLRIFIEADESVALQRRIKRDGMERGYPEDDVMYKWENHVVPAYKEFLLPYKDSCNKIVINNNDTPDDIIRITEEITEELKAKFCK